MARVGYRRVSSFDQNLERQDLGEVEKVFEEKVSAAGGKERPALQQLIEWVRDGDETVIWSIDRLARDLRDLQMTLQQLLEKGVTVVFLSEGLRFAPEASDPLAKFQLQLMGAFAEFERNIIRKRQAEGIARAKARGVYSRGRKRIDRAGVRALRSEGLSTYKIAAEMDISRMSVHRILREPENEQADA